MKNLADRIAKLTPEQRAMFEAQLKAKNLKADKIMPKEGMIPRRGHNNPSPLSYDQERLWFFHQMNPDKPTYNVYGAIRMTGKLDVEAMEWAVNEILRRHESWRTTFDLQDGQPVQIVHDEMIIKFDEEDVRDWPEETREAEAEKRMYQAVMVPIDIQNGPCVRVKLIRVTDLQNIVILTVHHLITDRVTFSIVFQELVMHYTARLQGRPSMIPEPQIQYADYTEWQRKYLTGAERDRLMNYWMNKLDGSDFVLNLPTDYPRPPVQSYKGARHFLEMPKSLGDRLKEFGTKEGATPFMILMAVYKLLLFRWTGQEDIIVGTPLANRDKPEMERVLGYFLTSGVFRTLIQGGMTFRELLASVREHALEAFQHAGMPFGLILDELKPKRDASRNPIFQAMFVYVDVPEPPMDFPDLKIAYELIDGETAKYDIVLCLVDRDGIVDREDFTECFLEYSPDLFDAATIARMGEHWLNLVKAVVDHPDMPLAELPMLTDAELALLDGWNQTEAPTGNKCLHTMFEENAARKPELIALERDGKTMTYGELNERANRLAHYLVEQGVRPDDVVGICPDRNPEGVIGIMAILKAGGAFLPLDSKYPAERLGFMLSDAGAKLLLSPSRLVEQMSGFGVPVVALDGDNLPYADASTENPVTGVSGEHVAYVIYTSGSTGLPKGVPVEHRGATNCFESLWELYTLGEGRRMLHFASFTFDASVMEIFCCLSYGGTTILADREQMLPGPELLSFLHDKQINIYSTTPSVLAQMTPESLPHLEQVITAGDAVSQDIIERWTKGGRRLLNAYGPTEVSIITHSRLYTGEDSVPVIGYPVKNTTSYVLDPFGQRVPLGVPGELYIGGIGVARGYLNRPELQAERFIPDPFSTTPGARLYRTGDLVRYRLDGQLEYLGRCDHQVKVRGYRIELGEVQARIMEHELVLDALAMAPEDITGTKRLVAYVVTEGGQEITADLRGYLRERLPEFMVPSVFIFMDSLPLNTHGKIDRSRLPEPAGAMDDLDATYVAPRNDIEEVVANIWKELLELNRAGVFTHFFDLGGHSLLATQMISRVRDTFQVNVPMADLFEVGTIADIAKVLVKYEPKPGHIEKVARVHKKLAAMSDDQVSALLGEKKAKEERV